VEVGLAGWCKGRSCGDGQESRASQSTFSAQLPSKYISREEDQGSDSHLTHSKPPENAQTLAPFGAAWRLIRASGGRK
jgi:hypothetical protein